LNDFYDPTGFAVKLCEALNAEGIKFRLYGSCAIKLKCGENNPILNRFARCPKDIDGVICREDINRLRLFLLARKWDENIELMTNTDGHNLLFRSQKEKVLLDVSVDTLQYAQTLNIRDSINQDSPTLPAADLLLSKLQIPHLTQSDIIDLIALLQSLSVKNNNVDGIDLIRIENIASISWRWYKSITLSLKRLSDTVRDPSLSLEDYERQVISRHTEIIQQTIVCTRKTLMWKIRAAFGELLPWKNPVELPVE
jgi:hypothetical protein